MSSETEQKALAVANSRVELRNRLMYAKSCLSPYYSNLFGRGGKLDFDNKRLIGNNGLYLQWQIRRKPEESESYSNQQTSMGFVILRSEVQE